MFTFRPWHFGHKKVPSIVLWIVVFVILGCIHESLQEFDVRLYAKKQFEGKKRFYE